MYKKNLGNTFLWFIINLAFFVPGIIVLADTSALINAMNIYRFIWISHLVLTILSGIFLLKILTDTLLYPHQDNTNMFEIIIQLGNCGVSIWNLVLFFSYVNTYQFIQIYNSLYYLTLFRVILTSILYGGILLLIVLSIIGGIFYECTKKKEEDNKELIADYA
jgi:hypothetical protein